MGRRCCIAGCQSSSRLPEHYGVTYHTFPLDPAIRSVWLKNTRLSSDRQITKSVLVCSRHFRRADFNPMKNGKYLLKHRVFPTVFPWGKIDAASVEADQVLLKQMTGQQGAALGTPLNTSSKQVFDNSEETTTATVAATVAQIFAETAELNASCLLKPPLSLFQPAPENILEMPSVKSSKSISMPATPVAPGSPSSSKFEPVTNFQPGVRVEAQDFDCVWHAARIVEVDNDDREVLIRFERTGKVKTPVDGTEEWIPMNSNRLRQKVSNRPILQFEVGEKCMARWSGPRRFPGTVKQLLPNDTYEVLFDDGYVKNVKAIHMSKSQNHDKDMAVIAAMETPLTAEAALIPRAAVALSAVSLDSSSGHTTSPATVTPTATKKSGNHRARKDWPLLDLSKLDLSTLDLPEIPRDGEWTCHWVNDQPIGKEGYLVVGEHRKPTVIVEDWRLPPGWVKHMYQRSNVLGKWDVILVSPQGKRFRSKSDLKVYLEEKGQTYNPDIYDFSIHRRRAKDINAYVFTSDYTPQTPKPKVHDTSMDISQEEKSALATSLELSKSSSHYMETPIATATPPMELMTSPVNEKSLIDVAAEAPRLPTSSIKTEDAFKTMDDNYSKLPVDAVTGLKQEADDGYAYIGGLKVQIVDNLFQCPDESCSKTFRKENHVQIHIKHYHRELAKLLGSCPKMLELAEKRTHNTSTASSIETSEPVPKNQIPNQQFFAKLHQQDLEHSRSHRRQKHDPDAKHVTSSTTTSLDTKPIKLEKEANSTVTSTPMATGSASVPLLSGSPALEQSLLSSTMLNESLSVSQLDSNQKSELLSKSPNSRSHHSRRPFGSRRSNRQRTTRRFVTAASTNFGSSNKTPAAAAGGSLADNSFASVTELEETRHSFNATPEIKKRRQPALAAIAPSTPLSSVDSPITADSGSSSFQQQLQAPTSSNDQQLELIPSPPKQPKYIQENGEMIKIVRMRQTEIINCLCGYGEEDGLMIQCELCFCWQHGACNGIDKVSEVPDKYVCYLCRNPLRGRESMRHKHDQEWLYDGKLPTANYHRQNPNLQKRFDYLQQTHTVTGNLIALKNFMHSLKVKMTIANNRCHPKLYLWAKQWDEDEIKAADTTGDLKSDIKTESECSPTKRAKLDEPAVPNIPLPEAPIDPEECQHRLHKHIKVQQELVSSRLTELEAAVDTLENTDELPDLKDADVHGVKDLLSTFIRELDVMRQIAKLNSLEHAKKALKQQQQQSVF